MSRLARQFDRQEPDSPQPNRASERPTLVRYGVLAFSVVMSVILYLDRMAISVALPAIAEDLDLQLGQLGDSVAAFFWCYALCQVPAGWLGDRWGGRRALTAYVVVWSAAVAGLGLVGGLFSLLVMRALLGIGQAGAYATTASFLRRWFPPYNRGMANSAVSLGGRAGNVLAPVLTSALMGLAVFLGHGPTRWRLAFFVYAGVGFLWALAFWRWFRDEPRLHSACNAAEAALIAAGEPTQATVSARQVGAIPLEPMLRNLSLQVLALVNFLVNVGWIFVGTWLPTFLIRVHGMTELEAGFIASLTAASGMAGCLCGGIAADWLARRIGLCWARRLPALISYGGAALAYVVAWCLEDKISVNSLVTVLVVGSFLGDFALGALWATYQDIGGTFAGTVLGWANMWGNIGAACASSLIGRLANQGQWPAIFGISAIAYLAAALLWMYVDPRKALRLPHSNPDNAPPAPG